MHRLSASVLALVVAPAAALALVLGLPTAARAGGPTSVLVTQPGEAAAALYYTDSRYAALEELVSAESDGEVAAPSSLGNGGQTYSLAWMIHDQLVWRTDRVHVDDGQVYVETTLVDGDTDPDAGGSTTWRRAAEGARLLRLLRGLLDGTGDGEGTVDHPSEVAEAALAESSSQQLPDPGPGTAGWWWALPGLAVGCAAGLLAGRRSGAAPGRRRVLVDAGPPGA